MTQRQKCVLDYIQEFIATKGYAPSYVEIGKGLGLRSLATVHKHVKALGMSGRIKQKFNSVRSLEVTPRRDTLLDAIAAERERCARIVSGHANCGTFAHGGPYGCTREIDRQIREGE